MTWREKTLARILLLVAVLLCDDREFARELKHLSNHIGMRAPSTSDLDAERQMAL